jgi:hypothetical protein
VLTPSVCFTGAFANFDGMENSEHQSDIEEGFHTTALPSNQHTLRGRARSLAQLCSGSSLIPCGATGSRATICSGGLTERCISNNSGFAQYMQISNSVCGRCSSPVCQFECCDDSDCKDPNNPTCSPSENICFNAQRLIPLSALLTWNGTGRYIVSLSWAVKYLFLTLPFVSVTQLISISTSRRQAR